MLSGMSWQAPMHLTAKELFETLRPQLFTMPLCGDIGTDLDPELVPTGQVHSMQLKACKMTCAFAMHARFRTWLTPIVFTTPKGLPVCPSPSPGMAWCCNAELSTQRRRLEETSMGQGNQQKICKHWSLVDMIMQNVQLLYFDTWKPNLTQHTGGSQRKSNCCHQSAAHTSGLNVKRKSNFLRVGPGEPKLQCTAATEQRDTTQLSVLLSHAVIALR